jgi:hypothetical protein
MMDLGWRGASGIGITVGADDESRKVIFIVMGRSRASTAGTIACGMSINSRPSAREMLINVVVRAAASSLDLAIARTRYACHVGNLLLSEPQVFTRRLQLSTDRQQSL